MRGEVSVKHLIVSMILQQINIVYTNNALKLETRTNQRIN